VRVVSNFRDVRAKCKWGVGQGKARGHYLFAPQETAGGRLCEQGKFGLLRLGVSRLQKSPCRPSSGP
jgi:hypothetical protein